MRSLRFDDKPDYAYLRKLFRDLFVREGERCCGTGEQGSGWGPGLVVAALDWPVSKLRLGLGCMSAS